ncbi:MAG: hypothetical protein LJE66_01510 [Desulfobacterales bacterium]|nr:hypothetical protein [Desulfobacterales bacterium]
MKWFEEIKINDSQEVGRKAFELSRLKKANFPVPNGFVITHSTCRKIISKGLDSKKGSGSKSAMDENVLYEQITDEILSGFRMLGRLVAVRSSAAEEDREKKSFAGQYGTVLNVGRENDLFNAIESCFNSQFSKQVQEYARRNKISGDTLNLSVLVQKQIQPDVSGVLFTVNPVTGNDHELVVEAVKGLGESLVAGKVQPYRYLINGFSEKIVSQDISGGRMGVLNGPDKCMAFKNIQNKQRTPLFFDEEILWDLVRMAMRIQTMYGCPQDIEWAVADRSVYILQTRPITAMGYQGIDGEWTTADFRDGGVSSEVVAPFMWSLYKRVFESAMNTYLKEIRLIPRNDKTCWSKVYFGRPYWNVGAVKKALARMPGFNERNFDQDLGIEITYETHGVVTPFSLMGALQAIPVMVALKRTYYDQHMKTQKAVMQFKRYLKLIKAKNLSKMTEEDLEALFVDLVCHRHFELETAYFKTIFNTANARLEFKAVFDKANKEGAGFRYLPLITALRPLKPVLPLFKLWEISRYVREDPKTICILETGEIDKIFAHPILGKTLKNFIKKYGHHSTRELDLRMPRWSEDPTFIIETLQAYIRLEDENNPQAHVSSNRSIYENELDKSRRFFSGFRSIQRMRFMKKLNNVRLHTWYKEEVRDWSTQAYNLIRSVSLEVGRRMMQRKILDKETDVFYLSYPEVIDLMRDKSPDLESIRRRIRANKTYMLSFRHFENPNEIGRRWHYRYERTENSFVTREKYKGIPCSSGETKGVVRVIHDISEADKLRAGDILVTRFTDPGWTPLFPLISGVITETGGILSHAAVIAREYGIPAVLAVQRATDNLVDGQRVMIDGSKGEVQILC